MGVVIPFPRQPLAPETAAQRVFTFEKAGIIDDYTTIERSALSVIATHVDDDTQTIEVRLNRIRELLTVLEPHLR